MPDVAVLAFDVYGTLVDTGGQVRRLAAILGSRSSADFSDAWRQTQLAYTFRRGLMGAYVDFDVVTAQALDATAASFGFDLALADRRRLLEGYRSLPPYDDVPAALRMLAAAGRRCVAFSNGVAASVTELLEHAGLSGLLDDVVSVDEVGSYKPDPVVYQHLLERVGAEADSTMLVSGNSFDVIGAKNVGLRAAWLRRSDTAVLDPWGVDPDVTVRDLTELAELSRGP
jgi:2-haloacid dehalogenase